MTGAMTAADILRAASAGDVMHLGLAQTRGQDIRPPLEDYDPLTGMDDD